MTTKVCVTFFIPSNIEGKEETYCTQAINLSEEAYEFMTSKEAPEGENRGEWNKMGKNKRLIKHLARIKDSLGASKFTFEVLPD